MNSNRTAIPALGLKVMKLETDDSLVFELNGDVAKE